MQHECLNRISRKASGQKAPVYAGRAILPQDSQLRQFFRDCPAVFDEEVGARGIVSFWLMTAGCPKTTPSPPCTYSGFSAETACPRRCFKAQAVGELLGAPVWKPSLLQVVSAGALDYLIRYVWNQDVDKEAFSLRLMELPRADLNPETMTLAQKIREEGREEGMRQAIRSLLEVRFQVVPAGLLEEVGLVREMERLEALHRHAIRCASLDEFAAGL